MGNTALRLLVGACLAAATLTNGTHAQAAPDDLPAGVDLAQFYPGQGEAPDGWSLGGQDPRSAPSADSTTPPGCFFGSLSPGGWHALRGPGNSSIHVQVVRGSGLQAVRSWAEKCASFTMRGGGGVTGRNQMSVEPAEAPAAEAVAYRVAGQGPFVGEELELAGHVRGVLVLVSQHQPGDGAAAELYRKTVEKITAWRG